MKGWVDVFVVYPSAPEQHRRCHAGKAHTDRGVLVHAYGGGDTPYGTGWRAELEGTCSELQAIGAVYNAEMNAWSYRTSRGHVIPCVVLARVVRGRAR